MIKALHLLSDSKFADIHLARFSDPLFDNRFVYLGTTFQYEGSNRPLLEWVIPFSASYDELKQAAGDFDLVFVYNLDYIKSCFINGIAAKVLVCWHLYGTELYNRYAPFRYSIYSDTTQQVLRINRLTILAGRCKKMAGRIKYALLGKRADYDEIQAAMARVNFLAWYSKNEYDFLQAALPFTLPPFLPLNVLVKEPAIPVSMRRPSRAIWLGNSASPENNHLEMLRLFQQASFKEPVILPFSYGGHQRYMRAVKAVQQQTALKMTLLESFTDLEDFSQMLINCRAAVFNSYRQMALGTIFLAIKFGVRVYLNERNPSFSWLKGEGFCLYSIGNDLAKDLQNNQLSLSPGEIKQNQDAYDRLVSPGNNRLFLEHITALVHSRRGEYTS